MEPLTWPVAMNRLMGRPLTTACSLLNESIEFHPDAIERALAHQDSNAVRAVYNRTQYWDERDRMMQWWSDKIDSLKQMNAD